MSIMFVLTITEFKCIVLYVVLNCTVFCILCYVTDIKQFNYFSSNDMYIFIKDATLNSETTLPHSGVFVLQHMLAFDMIRAALVF